MTTKSSFGEFPFAFGEAYVLRREYGQGKWSYSSLAEPSLGLQQDDGTPLFDPFDFATVAVNDGIGATAGEEGERELSLIGPPM